MAFTYPYQAGVDNSMVDGINANLPDNANVQDNFSDVKVGTKAITGAATTATVTTSFTADGVIATANLSAGVLTASVSGTTITFTRTVTTNSTTISYIAFQKD